MSFFAIKAVLFAITLFAAYLAGDVVAAILRPSIENDETKLDDYA